VNYEIQVVTLPVSDVDRARTFYTEQAGFSLDVDYGPSTDFHRSRIGRATGHRVSTRTTVTTPASPTSPTPMATPGPSKKSASAAAIPAGRDGG
jgi:catechol 2,3-dioxygenase-like lactoylglutathione lyase family enzyme